jgi:Homeodomain
MRGGRAYRGSSAGAAANAGAGSSSSRHHRQGAKIGNGNLNASGSMGATRNIDADALASAGRMPARHNDNDDDHDDDDLDTAELGPSGGEDDDEGNSSDDDGDGGDVDFGSGEGGMHVEGDEYGAVVAPSLNRQGPFAGAGPGGQPHRAARAPKWRVTNSQKDVLLEAFCSKPYPSPDQKTELANRIGVTVAQVSKWFQHHREALGRAGKFKVHFIRARRTQEETAILQG